MDDTGFDLLCKGLPPDEAKLFRKILKEWCDGDEDSFPVQLALLTRAQWRAAALIPNAIKDSGKVMEQYLAEYRRQTAALTNDFAGMVDKKHGELKNIVSQHAEVVKRDVSFISNRLVDANEAAKRIQASLQSAAAEWNQSKDALVRERQRFEKVCQKLDDAINLRGVHWYVLGTLAACIIALLIGHYVWHR